MIMNFTEKFNFLMDLTGTHNSQLARTIAIDASLVSRWRGGTRTPVSNYEMMAGLGEFFAQRLTSNYQKAEARRILGDLYEQCSGFLSMAELLTLWLQGKTASGDKLQTAILDGEFSAAEKMAMLLHAGLLKKNDIKIWLLISLPVFKAESILQEFLAFTAACEKELAAQAEINIILPHEVMTEIFVGSIGKIMQAGNAPRFNFRWYEMASEGVFETVAFAIENIGGIAYSGTDFTQRGFNKVYSGEKLAQLLGMLKNVAAKSAGDNFNRRRDNIQDFVNKFNSLKMGANLKPNALYISDRGGVSRYIKADSERLWGLPVKAMLGRSTTELERSGSYYPSITRMVLESGGSVCTMQTTGTGCELFVIGMPLLDADGKIEYIVNLSSEIKNKNQG